MITQYTFGEFLYTERIETPVDWMPALKSIVRWYKNCVRAICVRVENIQYILENLHDVKG